MRTFAGFDFVFYQIDENGLEIFFCAHPFSFVLMRSVVTLDVLFSQYGFFFGPLKCKNDGPFYFDREITALLFSSKS